MDERRKSQRHNVTDGISGRIKPTMSVRVLNISEHGLLLETSTGLPPAGMCEVTIDAPSGTRMFRARVARCRAHMVKGKNGKVSILFHAGLEFPESVAGSPEVRQLMAEICADCDSAVTRPIPVGTIREAM